MKTTYTTRGSVTGTCGHAHRTPETAQRCADKHHRGIVAYYGKGGAYSDRYVKRTDGEPMSADEAYAADCASYGARGLY